MTFIVDGTNGLTFNNSTVQASAGVVLQVVQGTYATQTLNTTTTYADTGLTTSITPKFSTSKILVLITIPARASGGTIYGIDFQLVRGSTAIPNLMTGVFYRNAATTDMSGPVGLQYLDSPATTSSTAYKVQFKVGGGGTGNQYVQIDNNTSYITLMEIAV